MHRKACALLAALLSVAAPAHAERLANLIIGGGMQNCTSTNPPAQGSGLSPNCAKPWSEILAADPALAGLTADRVLFDRTEGNAAPTYRVDAAALAALAALPESILPAATKQAVLAALQARRQAAGHDLTGLDREALAAGELQALATRLNPTEWAAVLDSCLEPAARPPRRVQARSVAFLTQPATAEIYRSLVSAARDVAGGRRPLIGFVTAASANPYAEHDINLHALRSAGADVVWLPLSGALRRAMDQGLCAQLPVLFDGYANTASGLRPQFHLHLDYPDLAAQQRNACDDPERALNAVLRRLDGIFLAGGDQARLLESLVSRDAEGRLTRASEQLLILQQRHAAGTLVVAGSSAGNAAQAGGRLRSRPVAMISGGESWQALANGFARAHGPTVEGAGRTGVTYPEGGLGLFSLGALDSHFSQRSREGRLLRFVADSGLDYGFGVDENTALLVARPDAQGATAMRVIGAGGVFVVDLRSARAPGAADGYRLDDATIHYLRAEDRAVIDAAGQLTVQLTSSRPLLVQAPDAPALRTPDLQHTRAMNFAKLLQAMGRTGAAQASGATSQSPQFDFRFTRTPGSEFRAAGDEAVSYANVRVSIAPCRNGCLAAQSAAPENNKVP